MAASLELGNLYMRAGKYTQALAVAHRALEEDNYNEVFHRSAMVAYSALDDRPAVVRQFENCKRILRKELNIDPSPQTITLYNSLVQ
jgi:DNA-binding SARP family transcriptional activator